MPYQYVPQQPYYSQMFGQPQMMQQPMTQPMQPQMQPTQMPATSSLQGRMVTSREEALGVPVDFSGAPMLFPDLAHGVIYFKQFNSGTGSSDFREFRLNDMPSPAQREAQPAGPAYATLDDLDKLRYEVKEALSKMGVKEDE